MLIYILVFFIAILVTILAHKSADNGNKTLLLLFSFIAVVLPSALAGVRDSGIGYDTEVYGNFNFEWLSMYAHLDIKSFVLLLVNGEFGGEWLYIFWIYLSIKLTGDIHWYYFSISLFICLFTYIAIYQHRNKASMGIMMFVFLFSFYNISLAAMRQSMALALALFSYKYFEERSWKVLLPLLLLCIWCHNSAIFYVVVLFFVWLQQEEKISSNKLLYLILLIPFSFLLLDPVLNFLVDVGIFPAKYEQLYSTEESHGGFMAANTLLSLILFGILKIGKSSSDNESNIENGICVNNQMLYVAFLLSMLVSIWAFRISYYFYYMNILFIPIYLENLKNTNAPNHKTIKYLVFGMIAFIWLWTIVIRQENATYPYESEILQSLF